jgi:hypothetical protein
MALTGTVNDRAGNPVADAYVRIMHARMRNAGGNPNDMKTEEYRVMAYADGNEAPGKGGPFNSWVFQKAYELSPSAGDNLLKIGYAYLLTLPEFAGCVSDE